MEPPHQPDPLDAIEITQGFAYAFAGSQLDNATLFTGFIGLMKGFETHAFSGAYVTDGTDGKGLFQCGGDLPKSGFAAQSANRSPKAHRFQHGLGLGYFVRTEQVSLSKRGEHREVRFGGADFLAETLERMR